MSNLSKRINDLFKIDKTISLKRGGPYFYIGEEPTKINGKEYPFSFEYKISDKNKKRVTLELIVSIYHFYNKNGRIPKRFEINEANKLELKSRPCNYSVAKFIVEKLIQEDNLI